MECHDRHNSTLFTHRSNRVRVLKDNGTLKTLVNVLCDITNWDTPTVIRKFQLWSFIHIGRRRTLVLNRHTLKLSTTVFLYFTHIMYVEKRIMGQLCSNESSTKSHTGMSAGRWADRTSCAQCWQHLSARIISVPSGEVSEVPVGSSHR